VNEKKKFKVLNAVTRKDGKTFWNRLGVAYVNKDNSINVYLDAFPKDFQFQIREYDDEDFKPRRDRQGLVDGGHDGLDAPLDRAAHPASTSLEAPPF
jgi:hypothetical protein